MSPNDPNVARTIRFGSDVFSIDIVSIRSYIIITEDTLLGFIPEDNSDKRIRPRGCKRNFVINCCSSYNSLGPTIYRNNLPRSYRDEHTFADPLNRISPLAGSGHVFASLVSSAVCGASPGC